MYFRRKTSAGRAYLQIVESRRTGEEVRQQVIATLGRYEDLQASGQLERLLRSGARFAAKAMVLSAATDDAALKIAVRRIGPALVFERLWEETGCRAVIGELAGKRKHGFPLERAVFLTVLHRLFVSGSDRAADRWREDYTIAGDGRPVCSEMWPGNTADVTTLIPVIDRLRRRFDIARVCVVADRGMISAVTLAELEARGLFYILGVRERSDKLVRELVLDDPAPFVPFTMNKRGKQADYAAKTVTLAGRRYIVCRNHQEAEKDAADRASILAALERQLAKGDKALVGNTG